MAEVKLIGCPLLTFHFTVDKQPADDFEKLLVQYVYHNLPVPIESSNLIHSGYDFTFYIQVYQHDDVDPALKYMVNYLKERGFTNIKIEIKEVLNAK